MRRVPAQRGVTLVELLVTIILAGIVFAALVPVFVLASKSGSADKVRLQAVNVAQDKLERIRQLDYDLITQANLSSEENTETWQYAAGFGPTWESDRGRVYDVWYTVEELSDAADNVLYKRVSVTVDWTPPPARAPNSFTPPDRHLDPGVASTGVTLRTFIYKQYAGPQIIDLYVTPDTTSGSLTWDSSVQGGLMMTFQAVISPQDDDASVAHVAFKGYGGSSVPVVDEQVSLRTGDPARFSVAWSPETDGSEDGLYRFEATAYSTGDLPGNTYAEQFLLETGRPPAPSGLTATPGDQVVRLTWPSTAADVVSYEVYRQVAGGEPASVGTVVAPDFRDTGLANGTEYTYYVIASDGVGPGQPSATVSATPLSPEDTTPPPPPTVTSQPRPAQAVLTWSDVVDVNVAGYVTTGIDHYLVYEDDDPIPSAVLSPRTPGADVTFATEISANHRYSVSSVDLAQNESARSAPVFVVYTPPPLHDLTVTSNRRADFTVRDAEGVIVGSASNATLYVVNLPEGNYTVTASRANVVRGPVPVQLDGNETCSFTF